MAVTRCKAADWTEITPLGPFTKAYKLSPNVAYWSLDANDFFTKPSGTTCIPSDCEISVQGSGSWGSTVQDTLSFAGSTLSFTSSTVAVRTNYYDVRCRINADSEYITHSTGFEMRIRDCNNAALYAKNNVPPDHSVAGNTVYAPQVDVSDYLVNNGCDW